MYKQNKYIILSNEALTDDVYKMVLGGDTQYITAPGQFINIQLDGKFLRRPISVCDYDDESITIIYKVVGEGTQQMKNLVAGEFLDLLTGLGNGYDISKSTKPSSVSDSMYCQHQTLDATHKNALYEKHFSVYDW